MNIYELNSVVDNDYFGGLASGNNSKLFETWPKDWRRNYQTWEPLVLAPTWPTPTVRDDVKPHDDFPCIDLVYPAFSPRAVEVLRDMLEPNGELLPVRHAKGTYYFYNCRKMMNCVDLTKSKVTKLKDGGLITDTEKLVFFDDMLEDLTIFKVRTQMLEVFCTQTFVDRVNSAGLQGFMFIHIWPLPEGRTFYDNMNASTQEMRRRRPRKIT